MVEKSSFRQYMEKYCLPCEEGGKCDFYGIYKCASVKIAMRLDDALKENEPLLLNIYKLD